MVRPTAQQMAQGVETLRKASGRATPAPAGSDAPKARIAPLSAPSGTGVAGDEPVQVYHAPWPPEDPGPPPRYPAPSREAMAANADLARMLFDAGRAAVAPDTAREHVRSVDVFRQAPVIHQYKAELLAWLDASEAYHKLHSPHLIPK